MLNGKSVSVVIPALNEADKIGATISAINAEGWADEIVVVDDGSRDNTRHVAANSGAVVIALTKNKGKGNALNEGVWQTRGDIIVFIDADVGESAVEATKMVEAVALDSCDLAIGSFTSPGGFGLAKKFARWGVRKLGAVNVEAPLSGQRAMNRSVLKATWPFQRDFGVEVRMLVDAARAGFRIREVPVDMKHRAGGRNVAGFLHRGKQFVAIFRALVASVLKPKRKT